MDADPAASPDPEFELPCAEALLAGTVALMTSYAQGCCEHHRSLVTRKIVLQLGQLAQHPLLSEPFRAALWHLRGHWQALQERSPQPAPDPRLWHASPDAMQ